MNRTLAHRSFKRNQNLLDWINQLSIHHKLLFHGEKSLIDIAEIQEAKEKIKTFLNKLIKLAQTPPNMPMFGIDARFVALIQLFTKAKEEKERYKSLLFKEEPQKFLELLDETSSKEEEENLISSLQELRFLINDHNSKDLNVLFARL